MKVLKPGHSYRLKSLDGDRVVEIHFVQRIGEKYPGNKEKQSGTTSQENIRALIERNVHTNNQERCWQNVIIYYLYGIIIYLLEMRHYHKHKLGFSPPFKDIHLIETCDHCGHTKCRCSSGKATMNNLARH